MLAFPCQYNESDAMDESDPMLQHKLAGGCLRDFSWQAKWPTNFVL